MKSHPRFERSYLLLPVCAAAVLCITGCANQTELLLPEGAFTPENSHIPANNASPAPGIAVQRPAGSDSIGGTMNLGVDDSLDMQPAPVVKDKAPAPAPTVRRPPVKKVVTNDVIYKVRKGDTLGAIAKRYKIHWRAVAEYNGLDSKARIYPGQSLRIPAVAAKSAPVAAKIAAKGGKIAETGKIHVVKKGEYPGKIAAMYKVRLSDLLAINNIKGKKTIYPGQKLRIPNAVPVAAKKQTAKKPAAKKVAGKKAAVKKAQPKKVAQKKKSDIPVIQPEKKKATGDDVLNSIDQAAPAAKKPAAAATVTSVAVAPVKNDEKDSSNDTPTVVVTLDKDMTLEQVAQAYDRSADTLKKYNPNLRSGETIKAATSITIPIF